MALAGACALALAAGGWMAIVSVGPAQGSTAVPPWEFCNGASVANQSTLEANLSPANGASVQAGTSVAFSGISGPPVTFAVASSPTLLSTPDIDGGSGSAQAEPHSSAAPVVYAYTFTSTKATATPRTVYWNASFSDASLPGCEGLSPQTYTTQARTLTVLPTPPPGPVSTPSPVVQAPALPVAPSPMAVTIGAPHTFHLDHPTVLYSIHCTARCSGDTYYEVLVFRRREKMVRAPKLELRPEPVSIANTTGGNEQFTHDYSGGALRMLRSILRSGGVVELRINAEVTDASGNVIRAQRTARLRM